MKASHITTSVKEDMFTCLLVSWLFSWHVGITQNTEGFQETWWEDEEWAKGNQRNSGVDLDKRADLGIFILL